MEEEWIMIGYSVEVVARELMFTPSELQDIFEIYFEEAAQLLPDCHAALAREDYAKYKKIMHSFKGASLNLRMTKIGTLAEKLEEMAKEENEVEIVCMLARLQEEITIIEKYVTHFYMTYEK